MSGVKLVYVAGMLGPKGLTGDSPAIEYLGNTRAMNRFAREVMRAGFTPFIPSLDMMLFMSLEEGDSISEEEIKQYSMDWLEACDAIVMMPGWEYSQGAIAERYRAEVLGLPVFYSLEALKGAKR